MTDDDVLLAAIRAAYDDHASRAVLADRLLERGDTRGELIHVQCLLETITADDPRTADLSMRLQVLLGDRRPPRGTTAAFRRGFVEEARVAANHARDAIEFLSGEPLLTRLHIEGCGGGGEKRWSAIGALLASSAVAHVRTLSFGNVIWYWYESDWDDTGRHEREEVDESPDLIAMLATVAPPPNLVELDVPCDKSSLPAAWRR